MILDGKLISDRIKEELKKEVVELKKQKIYPKLVVFQVGDDKASKIYVRNKKKACENVGIILEERKIVENVIQEELEEQIIKCNQDKSIHGILVQSPLPGHLNERKIFDTILESKDVDGLTTASIGKLWNNQNGFVPCTAKGVIRILKEYNVQIEGKHIVILGRSNIVGKPLASLFLKENASVTILHSKSEKIKEIAKTADILVSAVGIPKFVTEEMVKKDAVIIDVGINQINGKVVGDVDFEQVKQVASYITPVPNGVGPMTVAMLLENVVIASKR